jgi:uncharacterized membrane protein
MMISMAGKHMEKGSFRTIFVVLAFLVFFMLSSSAAAYTVTNITVTDYLQLDQSLSETISIRLSGNNDTYFSIVLPENAYNFSINNESAAENNTLSTPLNCTECVIIVKYSLEDIVRKDPEGRYVFDRILNFPKVPSKFNYILYLPQGYSIDKSTVNNPSVAPLASGVLTDGGHIILTWIEDNPRFPKQYHVRYKSPELLGTDVLWKSIKEFNVWVYMIIVFILGIILGSFLHRYWYHKTKPKPMPILHRSLLSPDEQKIMSYLKSAKANKTPVNQKDIGRELGWSKSKVSAILTTLDYKKLIEREKFGRNYKVKMIKDLG